MTQRKRRIPPTASPTPSPQSGGGLFRSAWYDLPDIPTNITDITDDILMQLFVEFTGWQNYAATQFADAGGERERSEARCGSSRTSGVVGPMVPDQGDRGPSGDCHRSHRGEGEERCARRLRQAEDDQGGVRQLRALGVRGQQRTIPSHRCGGLGTKEHAVDPMTENEKYIVLRKDRLPDDGALAVLVGEDSINIVMLDAVVQDAVVIRRQDYFASP